MDEYDNDGNGGVLHTCTQCQTLTTFTVSDTGSYTCTVCYSQADDLFDQGVDDTFHNYNVTQSRYNTQQSQSQSQFQYQSQPIPYNDDFATGPMDFGGCRRKEFDTDVISSVIRSRYLNGLQVMIQLQCEVLVREFGVSALISGLVGPVWLRFLVCKGVTGDDWADEAVARDEDIVQQQLELGKERGEVEELKPHGSENKLSLEHYSIHGKRLAMIWFRELSREIPVSSTLAIIFLVCHVAREPILPTDVLRWALEGKLPYLSAFGDMEKHLGRSPDACPISDSRMFRPVQLISAQKLEAKAAKIAKKIGLDLPPVNFYAIASRYCKELSLPTTKKILATTCQICEWCAPPELYLSKNEFRIPTRVYVMSVLIVAMRIIFDINGYGFWESSLSDTSSSSREGENEDEDVEPQCHSNTTDAGELLQSLEAKYNEPDVISGFSSDLSLYIKYCEDVVFSENIQPYNIDENKLWTEFQEFYQNNKDTGKQNCQGESSEYSAMNNKRSRKGSNDSSFEQEKVQNSKDDKSTDGAASHRRGHNSSHSTDQDDDCSQDDRGFSASCSNQFPQTESSRKDTAIRRMKLEMEENKFCYIPPRTRIKRKAYLHYARKKQGVFTYAVHADYYILVRSCAKVAQVETRVMHTAVLSFERRLKYMEKKMDESLNLTHNLESFCDYCLDEP